MSRESYNRIKEFSKARNLSKLQERILLHKYYEDYFILIDDHKKKNGGNEPSPDTVIGFNSTLLSDMTLSTNINLAEAELESFTKKKLEKVKMANGWKNFGLSTLSSIIGSFLFTLIIILLFLMGESQIKSWIKDFGKEKTEVTQDGH